MNISEIKRKSLGALKGHWKEAVLVSVIMFLLNYVLAQFPSFIGDEENYPFRITFIEDVIYILLIPFSFAVSWFFLNLARGEKSEISYIFSNYKDAKFSLKLIGVTFVQGVFIFLWSLLLIVPGIIKSISYSQVGLILKDHPEMGILEAISESKTRMNGLKWKYFVLTLSFIGWAILSILTIGIGFLWLVPYYLTSLATFYEDHIADKNVTE